jgi:cell division protein FtsB
MFLPEISSLQAQVTDLQTSLSAAEDALHAANRTTQVSQKRCLGILQDLINARIDIADLKSRAEMDAVEKDNLVQEVGQLKDEVSRLQSGVEQITRIARGLIPL